MGRTSQCRVVPAILLAQDQADSSGHQVLTLGGREHMSPYPEEASRGNWVFINLPLDLEDATLALLHHHAGS